nr:hypothetical protein [Tanacetum cinerariifolium]
MAIPRDTSPPLSALDVKNMAMEIKNKYAQKNTTPPLSSKWKQKKAVKIKRKSLQKIPTSPAKQTVEASRQKKAIEIKDKSLHKKVTSPTKQTVEANGLVAYDQSVDDGECADAAPVSERLRFSESVIEFKDTKGVDDFSIVVDNLVIDSEIPKHFLIKYYDLCLSQMTYLHENLLKGMKVGFLRARISKLKGLLFELNELWEAKRKEQAKAEEEMKIIKEKLNDVRGVIKNLDVEIETLKQKKGQKLDTIFHKEANAPW